MPTQKMPADKKKKAFVLFSLLIIGGGVFYLTNNLAGNPAVNDVTVLKVDHIFYEKDGDIFSITPDKLNSVNISKQLNPDELVSSVLGIRIAYTRDSSSRHTVWVANGNGTNPVEVFSTVKTGCDTIKIRRVEDGINNVLFYYFHNLESEDGPPCVPTTEPTTEDGDYSYTQDAGVKKLGPTDPLLSSKPSYFSASGGVALGVSSVEKNTSQIVIQNHPQATSLAVSPVGAFAEYQGLSVSPNFKNLTYIHEVRTDGRPGVDYYELYVYNILEKKSRKALVSNYRPRVVWLNDDSFVFRDPPVRSWPVKDYGNLLKFSVDSFKKEMFLEQISDLRLFEEQA